MDRKQLKIVFMGTPEFAVEPLRALVENGFRVVGVVTMPDKPAGRGMKVRFSPVKQYAWSQNLPLLQPEKLKDSFFLEALRSLQADLQVVVAFRMLPEVVWKMPPMGTFNLHASLLPQYRGAAPIHWAVINGEMETGLTTFFLQQQMDTGDILLQERLAIGSSECTGSVHDRLMAMSGELVVKTVDALLEGSIRPKPQPGTNLTDGVLRSAPKLFKENTRIDWTAPGKRLYNFIRGLSPYPAAWTELRHFGGEILNLKIFEAEFTTFEHTLQPGTLITDGKSELKVTVTDGFIHIKRLQLAGRKALSTADFLCGFNKISDFFFL